MPLRFKTTEDRDKLAKRIAGIAETMLRAWDQGHDGSVRFTPEAIDDIRSAAAIVACCDVDGE
jgi:Flp pilus assembly CpaF family ATPase